MKVKLKWKVDAPPTGKFRSFIKRGWPYADYPDGNSAVRLYAETAYHPSLTKGQVSFPITIRVAFHHPKEEWLEKGAFTWRTLKVRAYSLEEAKALAQTFIENAYETIAPKVTANEK